MSPQSISEITFVAMIKPSHATVFQQEGIEFLPADASLQVLHKDTARVDCSLSCCLAHLLLEEAKRHQA